MDVFGGNYDDHSDYRSAHCALRRRWLLWISSAVVIVVYILAWHRWAYTTPTLASDGCVLPEITANCDDTCGAPHFLIVTSSGPHDRANTTPCRMAA